MEEQLSINIEQICSLNINYKKLCREYVYKPEIKIFKFIRLNKEGFHDSFGDFISNESILKDDILYIENKKVFYVPHILIKLSNDTQQHVWFKNDKELTDYVEQIKTKAGKWIDIS